MNDTEWRLSELRLTVRCIMVAKSLAATITSSLFGRPLPDMPDPHRAAIREQLAAIHEAALVAGQKQSGVADFPWVAHPAGCRQQNGLTKRSP